MNIPLIGAQKQQGQLIEVSGGLDASGTPVLTFKQGMVAAVVPVSLELAQQLHAMCGQIVQQHQEQVNGAAVIPIR